MTMQERVNEMEILMKLSITKFLVNMKVKDLKVKKISFLASNIMLLDFTKEEYVKAAKELENTKDVVLHQKTNRISVTF